MVIIFDNQTVFDDLVNSHQSLGLDNIGTPRKASDGRLMFIYNWTDEQIEPISGESGVTIYKDCCSFSLLGIEWEDEVTE
jgi:hypothetical protein